MARLLLLGALRVSRLLFRTVLLGVWGFLCWQQWQTYRSEPIASVREWHYLPLPGFTVCPRYPSNRSMTRPFRFFPWAAFDTEVDRTPERLYQRLALPLTAVVTECKGRECDCTPRRDAKPGAPVRAECGTWSAHVSLAGTCYTYREAARHSDASLWLRFGEFDINFMSKRLGLYKVEVHGSRVPVFGQNLASDGSSTNKINIMKPSQTLEFQLGVRRHRMVNLRRRPCSSRPYQECLLSCSWNQVAAVAGCRAPWITSPELTTLPSCGNVTQLKLTAFGMSKVNKTACDCLPSCVKDVILVESLSGQDDGLNVTRPGLMLRFKALSQVLVETRAFRLMDLLPVMGGNMGLLLGYSALSTVQSLIAGFLWLKLRLARPASGAANRRQAVTAGCGNTGATQGKTSAIS